MIEALAGLVIQAQQLTRQEGVEYFSFCRSNDLNCMVNEYEFIRDRGYSPVLVKGFYKNPLGMPVVRLLPNGDAKLPSGFNIIRELKLNVPK